VSRGLRPERVVTYPRGVDTRRFSPAHAGAVLERRFGVDRASVRLLYVGRVSKEKSLPLLCDVFRRLHARLPNVSLTVVGEGPWIAEMKDQLAGWPCHFTGYQDGAVLGEIFASCDLFVFPSKTDTFGKVVLESQASGLPVVVMDQGGPMENVVPGETGVIVPGGDADALLEALHTLATDRARLKSMGQAARRYAETRSVVGAFEAMWQMWREQPRRQPRGQQAPCAAHSNVFRDGPFAGVSPRVRARP
jgi:glycosyltransferase involved in cell wall biosynthesis